jgi:hypothetical protein
MELLKRTQEQMGSGLERFGTQIGVAQTKLTGMADAAKRVKEDQEALNTAMNEMKGDPIGHNVDTSVDTTKLAAMAKGAKEAQTAISELDKANLANLDQAIQGATTGFSGMAENATKAKEPVQGVSKGLLETVQSGAATVIDGISSAYDRMATAARNAAAAAREAAAAASGSSSSSEENPSGAYRQGGVVGGAMESVNVPMTVFANAPALASGIENTNQILSGMAGGGIPSILHPGEAVVPLSGGRSIPVEFSGMSASGASGGSTTIINNTTLSAIDLAALQQNTKALNSFSTQGDPDYTLPQHPTFDGDMKKYTNQMTSYMFDLARTMENQNIALLQGMRSGNSNIGNGALMQGEGSFTINSGGDAGSVGGSSGGSSSGGGSTKSGTYNINLTVNISAKDADSFVKSEDQIVRELGVKINKAIRRFG